MNHILLTLALTLAPQAWGEVSSERMREIKQVAEIVALPTMFTNVAMRNNDQLPMPAASYKLDDGSFLIEFNSTIMNTLTEAGRQFITYHELAHIRLGHVNMPWPGPEAAADYELEADAYATLLYRHLLGEDQALRDFIAFLEGRTHTVPSGPERARTCRAALAL